MSVCSVRSRGQGWPQMIAVGWPDAAEVVMVGGGLDWPDSGCLGGGWFARLVPGGARQRCGVEESHVRVDCDRLRGRGDGPAGV